MSRCVEPERDTDLVRGCWSSNVDPALSPAMRLEAGHGEQHASHVIINACKTYAWKDDFPQTNITSRELRQKILNKFNAVFTKLGMEKVRV